MHESVSTTIVKEHAPQRQPASAATALPIGRGGGPQTAFLALQRAAGNRAAAAVAASVRSARLLQRTITVGNVTYKDPGELFKTLVDHHGAPPLNRLRALLARYDAADETFTDVDDLKARLTAGDPSIIFPRAQMDELSQARAAKEDAVNQQHAQQTKTLQDVYSRSRGKKKGKGKATEPGDVPAVDKPHVPNFSKALVVIDSLQPPPPAPAVRPPKPAPAIPRTSAWAAGPPRTGGATSGKPAAVAGPPSAGAPRPAPAPAPAPAPSSSSAAVPPPPTAPIASTPDAPGAPPTPAPVASASNAPVPGAPPSAAPGSGAPGGGGPPPGGAGHLVTETRRSNPPDKERLRYPEGKEFATGKFDNDSEVFTFRDVINFVRTLRLSKRDAANCRVFVRILSIQGTCDACKARAEVLAGLIKKEGFRNIQMEMWYRSPPARQDRQAKVQWYGWDGDPPSGEADSDGARWFKHTLVF